MNSLNIISEKSASENYDYFILAFYKFTPIADPYKLIIEHRSLLETLDAKCRIYISEEGINGQLSIHKKDAYTYMNWLNSLDAFHNIEFKVHYYNENVYPRLTIKYRKQLVAFDRSVDTTNQGKHISPKEWKEMLNSDIEKIVIDTRNEYEWDIGHFEGSELPPCGQFRDFPNYTQHLKERIDPKKTHVMMCCTGGIRCEIYSAYLKAEGFENVYQLDGGIIKYGLEEGNSHWAGKLFVFDDRLVVPLSEEKKESDKIISHCKHCNKEASLYYNCANVECNELFVSCKECANSTKGCCCDTCQCAQRLRPYDPNTVHKPMKRWHNYCSK